MARTRRQSVPPPKRAGASAGAADLLSSIPQSFESLSTNGKGAKPCPQTDALARMTIELNMRAISSQAQRLENDLRLLVRNTEDDKEYRAKNETRISEIWTELLAVRTRVNEVHDGQEDASIRYEKCRQDADQSIRNFQQEISSFKSLCSNLSTQLDSLPTMADLDLVATQPLSDVSRVHHLARLQNERLESAGVRGQSHLLDARIVNMTNCRSRTAR
jgi:chromosome segregation ATPase